MCNNKKLFYYNSMEDIWQESNYSEDNIEYRLRQIRLNNEYYHYVYLPLVWSVELRPDRIVELNLKTKQLMIKNQEIVEDMVQEWVIECDFDKNLVQGWPISLVSNNNRHWRNVYVCGPNITFPQLLAARYVDIPAGVVDVAIEYLRDLAKERFGFRPSYLGEAHGLSHLIAFCESPLDPNLYLLKDVIGQQAYQYILSQNPFNNFMELCRYLEINNPPPSLRKAYVMNPENILIYLLLRQFGFHDINIIRRFFYRDNIFGYNLFDLKYNELSGILTLNRYNADVLINFQRFSHWLLRHRSEKELAPRFIRWFNEPINNAAKDTLRMFVEAEIDNNEDIINQTIRRRLLTDGLSEEVHDDLMNELFIVRPEAVNTYLHKENTEYVNDIYQYNEKEKKLEGQIDGYVFLLPSDRDMLKHWGNIFHNCVASYNSVIVKKLSVIVAMKREKKFIACIEVSQGRIIQALGYCNQKLPIDIREVIKKWSEKNRIYYGGIKIPL